MARVETDLKCTPISVEAARRFVEAALSVWELDDLSAVAVLLTSELVTNAILHARTAVRLAAERRGAELVVEVWDDAPDAAAVPRSALDDETGRGLLLVNRLVARWGVRRTGSRKVVWFALGLTT
ncbi:MAG: ATP-binding protein [Acidimicrobiales bacterium]